MNVFIEEENLAKQRVKNTKSTLFNIAFIIIVFVALIIYIINVEGVENIVRILTTADYKWIILGIIFLLAEWLLEAFVMHIPLKEIYPKHKFLLSLKVNIVGRMFNNITPFSSGGQPFQAYILSRNGLRVSDTFSVLMMKFVVYQVDLVLLHKQVVLNCESGGLTARNIHVLFNQFVEEYEHKKNERIRSNEPIWDII